VEEEGLMSAHIDQFTEFDNIVVFYYPKGSTDTEKDQEQGRVLQIPEATSYHPVPPNKSCQPLTRQGTIQPLCFYQPIDKLETCQTATIQVAGATSLSVINKVFLDRGISTLAINRYLKYTKALIRQGA
jgi:hypothetical protein